MATDTLVRVPTDDAAALMALALRKKGINVTEQFWMTPSEPGWRILALVSPDADGPEGYDLHRKILAALDDLPSPIRTFVGTRTMVFGEREIEKELSLIRSGYTKLPGIGPYEESEVSPIPPASEIHKHGFLHLRPLSLSTNREFLAEASFAPFGPGGFIPTRRIKDQGELESLFQTLNVPAEDREQINAELAKGRTSSTLLSNIGLDVLFKWGLV